MNWENFKYCNLCGDDLVLFDEMPRSYKCKNCHHNLWLCFINSNCYWVTNSSRKITLFSDRIINTTILYEVPRFRAIFKIQGFFELKSLDKFYIDELIKRVQRLKAFI